jgi:acyl carrier protein
MNVNVPSVGQVDLEREVADLIVDALRLEMAPDDIDPDTPLYGDVLGLDSIDMLEIALAVSKRYGVELGAEQVEQERVFASMRNLAAYVAAHRTR